VVLRRSARDDDQDDGKHADNHDSEHVDDHDVEHDRYDHEVGTANSSGILETESRGIVRFARVDPHGWPRQ